MQHRHVKDWSTLLGANVEIRQNQTVICSGIVDAVTEDAQIIWVHSPVEGRRLFEKAEFHQAWATEEGTGFHYKVNRNEDASTASSGRLELQPA
ncbi:hypothetical protein FHJ30_20915 [Arthrobacter sp. BB-1]|uniref:hypothetical protein n=1 Tax=unclassified Arthrobacter TaxID=235627 RepID=UPI001111F033|nr:MULTISPECIES: hypothetical protein [unclassified Arthrobacter]TNB67235.1 hypothetical protein FHJ30_20915 [Arthrobacter sp. BB-1]